MGPKRNWYQANRSRDERRATDGDSEAGRNEDAPNQHQRQRQHSTKKYRLSAINIGQVKGHQAVVGTCDVRHDKAATAELIDLLNAFADDLLVHHQEGGDAQGVSPNKSSNGHDRPSRAFDGASMINSGSVVAAEKLISVTQPSEEAKPPLPSVEEIVLKEAEALRAGRDKSQRFMSVNTSVKGVIMVCVMDPTMDVLGLVDAIFAEIRTSGKRRSRFLERVTPIQVTSFSEIELFKAAAQPVVISALPPVAESISPLTSNVAAEAHDSSQKTRNSAGGKEGYGAVLLTEESETPKESSSSGICEKMLQTTTGAASKGSERGAGSGEKGVSVSLGESPDRGAPRSGVLCKQQVVATGERERAERGSAADGGASTKTSDKRWKFRVDVRKRNSGLKRMDLINAVATSVGEGHSVSMASPDVTIVVEAIKSVVGASVLFNYVLNHEYSMSRLQDAVCGNIIED